MKIPFELSNTARPRIVPVERSIAYAYLPAEAAAEGTEVAVEIFGEWVRGSVASEPLYDPAGERIRA